MDPRVTDRQSQIIEILRDRLRPVSIPEVAERLQVSERTVQRDVGGLRKLGVVITTEPGRRGGLLLTDQLPGAPDFKGLDSHFPTPSTANLKTALPGDHFVGRGVENAQLDQALESALSGRRRITMVLGEPGIGKTRMIREFATRAESRGALAVWDGCRDIEGTPPYWPWTLVIRELSENAELVGSFAEADLAVIAAAIPELAPLRPNTGSAGVDHDSSRFQLFNSINSLLKASSANRPVLIALEDLHWADEGSLGLLQFLARRPD